MMMWTAGSSPPPQQPRQAGRKRRQLRSHRHLSSQPSRENLNPFVSKAHPFSVRARVEARSSMLRTADATVSSLISEGIKICRNGITHTPETQHGILGEIGAALKRVRQIVNRQQPSPNALGGYHSDFNYSQMLLYDFATNIDIPVAVAGHSDDCCVSFKLYTGFERASSTEKYRLAQMVPGGRNRDGMAINMASAMLEKRQEEIRMMIIISDGQPNSYAYSGEGAARDIREIIGKLRRKNIEVLAAGIGEDRERVKEIYGNDNYIDIFDLSALPKILTNVVRKKVCAAM